MIGRHTWNKGLTKDTDERVLALTELNKSKWTEERKQQTSKFFLILLLNF